MKAFGTLINTVVAGYLDTSMATIPLTVEGVGLNFASFRADFEIQSIAALI